MELYINPRSFELMEQGSKTVETRLGNDAVLSELKPGDTLTIVNRDNKQQLDRTVVAVRRYHSSMDVAANEDIHRLGRYDSAEAYIERMQQFQSDEEEAMHGVIAVELS